MSVLKKLPYFDNLLKIISYISNMFGKMAAYSDVSPQIRCISQQILLDHDRSMEKNTLKEVACDDIDWLVTLPKSRQVHLIMDLLSMGGCGLIKKMYIPMVTLYNKKVLEDDKMRLEPGYKAEESYLDDLFYDKHLDDSNKYPQDHPLSIEVEKLRRKWEETMEKYRREVFELTKNVAKEKNQKKPEPDKKTKAKSIGTVKGSTKKSKKGGTTQVDSVDWLQMLPIWIVKQIFGYLDQKPLLNLKKVNHYWSYASDSLIKERQARKFLDQSIEKMRSNVDPEIMKQFDEDAGFLEKFYNPVIKPNSPREKRLKKLLNRGAILKQMVHKVKESQCVQTNFLTNIPKGEDICMPLDKIMVFPRFIKEDLLLYKSYPCHLKDVNILIDVENDVRRQRETLSYSLSQQLSDTFSMSEANLADW